MATLLEGFLKGAALGALKGSFQGFLFHDAMPRNGSIVNAEGANACFLTSAKHTCSQLVSTALFDRLR